MAIRRAHAIALWAALGAVVLVLLVELISIRSWTSTSALGTTIGVIEYRPGLGGLNRLTMAVNEAGLWLTGARFSGPASYGTFDHWMHTYAR